MNIKEITKKDGSIVYRANIYLGIDVNTGKTVRTSITAKTQKAIKQKAKRAVDDFQANGCTRLAKTRCKTFGELMIIWWENQQISVKNNTKNYYKNLIKNYLQPALGSYRLEKITTALIQNQVNIWANNANSTPVRSIGATKSYNHLLDAITRIFKFGISIGAVTTNPARDVILPKLKRQDNKKIKYFTNAQLKVWYDYLDNLPNTNKNALDITIYKLLLATGLRISEALALNWDDVDFENATISVTKTLDVNAKLENTPKSIASVREIAIDTKTLLTLKQHQNRQRKLCLSLNLKPVSVVFSNLISEHIHHSTVYCRLIKHFTAANLPNIGFHGFRHTHASLLLNADVGYKELQHRLGHSQLSMTMDIYSHLSEEKARSVVDVFDQAMGNL